MADNVSISTAGGDRTVATDQISSVDHQLVKVEYGADGTATTVIKASTTTEGPLPVSAYVASDYLTVAGLGLVPKFAVINLTATGTVVAAVASKKIRVLAVGLTMDFTTGDETYTFKSGAAGTALTGAIAGPANAVTRPFVVLPFNPCGWFETTSGVLLELSLAGTTPISQGLLTYVEV